MAGPFNGEFAPEFQNEYLGEAENEFGTHETSFEDEMESALQGETLGEGALPELANEFGLGEQAQEFGLGEQGYEALPEMTAEGQQFFGKAFRRLTRGIGGLVQRAAPTLSGIARLAGPLLTKAVAGPLGGMMAGPLGGMMRGVMGQGEAGQFEDEFAQHEVLGEDELGLHEDEFGAAETGYEGLPELQYEGGGHETLPESAAHEVLAEQLAEVAAFAQQEIEAEAMAGAAAMSVLSPRDRAILRRLLPHLVRGVAVLTRLLRQRRITRPAVRTLPAIVRQTVRTLRRRVAAGQPVTRRMAGQALAAATRRVLADPSTCTRVIIRNVRATARSRPVRG
jgi:hypothetical protein